MALKIACVGESMIELSAIHSGPNLSFAGDTLNTGIYLRRALPPEHSVTYVSVVGQDPFSDKMLDFITSHHVATDGILRHSELLPGLYAIMTDENGEWSFLYWRENSAARTLFQNGFDVLKDFDVIFLSGITLAILPANVRDGLFKWLKRSSAKIVFDSNYRPRLWENVDVARRMTERAWRACDIALPSLDDEMALFGDVDEAEVLARLRGYGVKHGALKRGGNGCQSRRKKGPFAGVKVGQLRCRALLGVLPIKLTRDKAHVGQRPTSIKFRPGSGSGVSALF